MAGITYMRWLDVKHRVALRGQRENRPGFLFDRQRRTWQRLRWFANWFWGLSKVLCNYLHVRMVQIHPINTMFFVYVYICMYASCIYIYIITDKLACAYIRTCRQADRQTDRIYILVLSSIYLHITYMHRHLYMPIISNYWYVGFA